MSDLNTRLQTQEHSHACLTWTHDYKPKNIAMHVSNQYHQPLHDQHCYGPCTHHYYHSHHHPFCHQNALPLLFETEWAFTMIVWWWHHHQQSHPQHHHQDHNDYYQCHHHSSHLKSSSHARLLSGLYQLLKEVESCKLQGKTAIAEKNYRNFMVQ